MNSSSTATDLRLASPSATNMRLAKSTKFLSEARVKDAKPGDILRDETVPGLSLHVFTKRKSFYLYFRTKSRKERRPKLGDYGIITLTQARATAKKMLADVALGGDPVAVLEGKRDEPTMADLWVEFWKRHASRNKSAPEYRRRWANLIEPEFGREKISSVQFPHVCNFHEAVTKDHGPIEANQVLAELSVMFNFAHRPLQWFEGSNPCKGVRRNKETKRRRKASREELARMVTRLRKDLDGQHTAGAAFILLLLFTGARKSEIAHTRWDNIHGNRILLDEHKTDDGGYARIIYLPPPALELIHTYLPRTNGTITGIQTPKTLWHTICREENLPDLHLHDLRRTFASVALSTGMVSLEQVMQMLGHTNAQTTKVYAWLMEDSATEAINLVASHIEPKLLA